MNRSASAAALTLMLVNGGAARAWAQAAAAPATTQAATQAAPAEAPAAQAPASRAASDSVPVKVTPYAVVYFNGFNNTGGTNNEDVPLWAAPGTGDTSATARQTRFGLRATLPKTLGARLGAVVEADFFGGFPTIGTGENFGQLRLRLASVRLDWTRSSLVIGQDWMVFAPVNPVSLASAAIPLFAAAGNPWARLPQVRAEQRFGPGLLQAAVLAPQSGDFNSTFLAQPGSGALSKLPYFQARVAYAPRPAAGGPRRANVGVSGRYGESRFTPAGGTATDVTSAAGALDWTLPFGRDLLVTGEAHVGRNIGGFQSGVFQGTNPDAVSGSSPVGPLGIRTWGAWGQLVANPGTQRVTLTAGFGLDDPKDEDLVSASARNWRLRNEVAALGVSFRASTELSFGVEYRFVETRFQKTGTQKDRHLNLAAVLGF